MGRHQESSPGRGQAHGTLGDWLGEWANTIAEHHEKFDGTGYPFGLKGDEISLGGRIVAVADCYDTMTTVRTYKKSMSPKVARAELAACAGTHFDPKIVRAFLDVSIGRVRPVAGPLAWLGSLPFVSSIPQAVSVLGTGGSGIGRSHRGCGRRNGEHHTPPARGAQVAVAPPSTTVAAIATRVGRPAGVVPSKRQAPKGTQVGDPPLDHDRQRRWRWCRRRWHAAGPAATPAPRHRPRHPAAPTGVIGVAGKRVDAQSRGRQPDDGGSPITSYVVTPYVGAVPQAPATFTSASHRAS